MVYVGDSNLTSRYGYAKVEVLVIGLAGYFSPPHLGGPLGSIAERQLGRREKANNPRLAAMTKKVAKNEAIFTTDTGPYYCCCCSCYYLP